jgi:predicted RNA-binding Zn-ribbon protein involved in translation (DUF1610 family)
LCRKCITEYEKGELKIPIAGFIVLALFSPLVWYSITTLSNQLAGSLMVLGLYALFLAYQIYRLVRAIHYRRLSQDERFAYCLKHEAGECLAIELRKADLEKQGYHIFSKPKEHQELCMICGKEASGSVTTSFLCMDCGYSGVMHQACVQARRQGILGAYGIRSVPGAMVMGAVGIRCPKCGATA